MTTRRNVLASAAAVALIPAVPQAASAPSADAELLRLGAEFDRFVAKGDLLWARFRAAPDGSASKRSIGDECEAFLPQMERAADKVMATPPATVAGLVLWARVMVWRFDPTIRGIPAAPPPSLAEYGVNEAFALAAAVAGIASAGRTA
ncbi:MAG TPA: hypothetical protein VGV17_14395 [Bosea sp. (in: a-proteobacteria)]|jgi:hypothetical protein|uniref:hypothetical protein n=1 Tax=Bosea sp. (in: a-proteobacteria) TaxID=1871050 RepID=UPI002DDCB41F|nr:hypothetical protein [Bosea sp. (in: a-proteobacteria)]HEV2554943.1 hypothetical protein [Bosea sp. (in: a-proteobacteria)]